MSGCDLKNESDYCPKFQLHKTDSEWKSSIGTIPVLKYFITQPQVAKRKSRINFFLLVVAGKEARQRKSEYMNICIYYISIDKILKREHILQDV